ncbi:AAA family ATPase [Ancylobacter sp. VNQ12]|uniref:AAA family ATPase n=1 Tax=Ancylobacter sp. VNQ12 TaxID=3400920 RepID=UPI003C0CD8A8
MTHERHSVFEPKGGSGKTTLSVHTAEAAEAAEATGERVCVIDADPQETATAWARAREAGTPIVATAQAGELDAALRAAEAEGITLAVVDAPPHAAPAAGQIARRSQLVLIPVRPSAFDLAAVPAAVEIVTAAKVRGVFILSACPFRAPEVGRRARRWKPMGCRSFLARSQTGERSPAPSRPAAP